MMFIAMNRFRVKKVFEDEFESMWKSRETYLDTVPGFREFHLLRGASDDEGTLFASHSVWDSRSCFEDWTRSEAFKKAHSRARASKVRYLSPPQFEGFEAIL